MNNLPETTPDAIKKTPRVEKRSSDLFGILEGMVSEVFNFIPFGNLIFG